MAGILGGGTIGGSWVVDYSWSKIVPGTVTVKGWELCRVTINGIIVDNLIKCSNSKKTKQGSGTCEFICADADRSQKLLFSEGDEILIYIQETETANKVWGGYVETIKEQDVRGKQLVISGNEYSSRLNNQVFSATYTNTDLAEVVIDIMSNQTDFTTNNVISETGILIDAEFDKQDIFKALKKLADENNYTFWVDLDKDLHFESSEIVRYSSNTIGQTDNCTKNRLEQTNKIYLTNRVTVQGTIGVATKEDTTSQTLYGIHSRKLTVKGLNSASAVDRYAEEYVKQDKNPKEQQVTVNRFLNDVLPKYFIEVDIDNLGLSGYYQILEIKHNYGLKIGLNTEIVLGNNIKNSSEELATFERRITDIESKTF